MNQAADEMDQIHDVFPAWVLFNSSMPGFVTHDKSGVKRGSEDGMEIIFKKDCFATPKETIL
jgi:hypothetical protein